MPCSSVPIVNFKHAIADWIGLVGAQLKEFLQTLHQPFPHVLK